MLPGDPRGFGNVAGMFGGLIYKIDLIAGTGEAAFDCVSVTPHVETSVTGGVGQILAARERRSADLRAVPSGQVGMLDTTDYVSARRTYYALSRPLNITEGRICDWPMPFPPFGTRPNGVGYSPSMSFGFGTGPQGSPGASVPKGEWTDHADRLAVE